MRICYWSTIHVKYLTLFLTPFNIFVDKINIYIQNDRMSVEKLLDLCENKIF